MLLPIRKASREWGVSRQTLYNKMKEGELSYTKDERGNRQIDSSEMARVFGQPRPPKDSTGPVNSVSPDSQMVDLLREQLEKTEKRLERVEASLEQKDKALIELMETVQANMQLFLGHRPSGDTMAESEPEAPPVIAEEPKTEPVQSIQTQQPETQTKPKRGLFQRLASAAFDLD